PVTLASTSSLAQLNEWIRDGAIARGEEPLPDLPMERFRSNLVIDGADAFAEDDWTRVQVGEVTFRKAKAAGRCMVTTIDVGDLTSTKEPIRTLAKHRLVDRNTLFAIHLIPENTGRISLGDPVSVR